jgi:hypothetical protein
MYTFKKDSWHVRFYKWLYDTNPIYKFKTMCPYFWSYVLTIIFLPVILPIRLMRGNMVDLNEKLRERSYEKNKRKIVEVEARVIELLKGEPDKLYKFSNSKCYKKYKWGIDNNLYWSVDEVIEEYWHKVVRPARDKAEKEKNKKEIERKESINQIKNQTWFKVMSYALSGIVGLIFIYLLYFTTTMIPFHKINWMEVWNVIKWTGLIILGIGVVGFLGFLFVKYLVQPCINYLMCLRIEKCYLCDFFSVLWKYTKLIFKPFIWIIIGTGKLFYIIGHMLYSTYKKSCPMIEWKD